MKLREGKGTLGRPRRRYEENIKINIKNYILGYGLYSCGSKQGQWQTLVNTVMKLRVA
jgi:hypothetical protein